MITAWVFYEQEGLHRFHELEGTSFDSTDPTSWGLPSSCTILLVLHRGSFISAWIEGKMKDPRE